MKPCSKWSGKVRRLLPPLMLLAALSGCATTGPGNPADPLEGFNRAMFKFNDAVDTVALKPAATVYKNVLPSFVQTGVGNFFGNLADAWTAVNNLLQGKLEAGMTDVMRVAVNSTMGLGGLLDIGSEAGLPKHKEDFGQTLGRWGVKPGPYVVLPMFGPSTLRDTVAFPLDLKGDPWSYAEPTHTFVVGSVVRVVDLRSAALDASGLVEDAALDRYEFIRDAYLQRRESKVRDGEQQREKSAAVPALLPDEVVSSDTTTPSVTGTGSSDTTTPSVTGTGSIAPTASASITQLVPLDGTLASRAQGGVKLPEPVPAEVAKADEGNKPGAVTKADDSDKTMDESKTAGKNAAIAKDGKAASSATETASPANVANNAAVANAAPVMVSDALSSGTVAK